MNKSYKKILLLLSPLALGISLHAQAKEFQLGNIAGQVTSQISFGSSIATAAPDKRFISVDSGGVGASRTGDDGRLNFDKGDTFSTVFKGVHDLELKSGNTGVFLRGKYWYDFELKDGGQRFYDIQDDGRKPLQKASGAYLLDAFIYHDYVLDENPGSVRLGRQVVSWGESTFIGNSINTINPIDVTALYRPGSEIKEALLPVEMLYLSQGIGESLGIEAFYQLKWAPSAVPNCGTFFSFDPTATGCNDRLVVAGADLPQGHPDLQHGWLLNPDLASYTVRARKDKEASNSGQYGLALRYFSEELNNTEFGLYMINYHSRGPVQSYVSGPGLAGAPGIIGIDGAVGPAGYYFEHPEDIRLYGLSFQTNISGVAVSGELSYRPNMPIQVSTADLGRTALALGTDHTHRDYAGLPVGSYIKGYERKEYWQAQVSFVHLLDRILGASRMSLIGEIGASYISGLSDSRGKTQFGRDSVFGQSPDSTGFCASQAASPKASDWCETDGFFSSLSYGYRLRSSLEYSDVFAGINLSPSLAFSHDLKGYSMNFNEDAKAVSLGLTADYLSKYSANINYTNFFDGKYNTMVDRDFAAISFSVSF